MKGTLERYVDRVMAVADIQDPQRESAIRAELGDHLQEKVQELETEGYPTAEALTKAVEDHGNAIRIGYSLREWRFLDVRLTGTARGVVAIGPRAIGVVALGGLAVGAVACGGVAVGGITFGGLALAALIGWGGLATGLFAYGGLAIGLVAFGGMAVGVIASGGMAAGLWVPGAGQALGSYFTWETVPGWMRTIGGWFSFDPRSAASRREFGSLMTGLNVLNGVLLLLGFSAVSIFNVREARRVREIAGPTLE